MGNKNITAASVNALDKICTAQVTNGFFSEFVVQWSIPRIHLAKERYQDHYNLIPLELDDLKYIIPNISDTKQKLLFGAFCKHCGSNNKNKHNNKKTHHNKTCDGLSLLSGICMNIGHAQLLDRLKFIFVLYDFDCDCALNLSELTMMVRTTLGGMAALADLKCPAIEDLHRIAQRIFLSADINHDDTVSLDEFITWATTEKHAVQFFNKHQLKLDDQILKIKEHPNIYGNTELSSLEDAEKQLLENDGNELNLKNHYLGDDGLNDLIDDIRSHSKHSLGNSIEIISLNGNGISSLGCRNFLLLLEDASIDRYGSLGSYLNIKSLDLSHNSRIDNDIGILLLTLIDKLENLNVLLLNGTNISNKMKKQIHMKLQHKVQLNKGINTIRKNSKKSKTKIVPFSNNTDVANNISMISNLKKFHVNWKSNITKKLIEREKNESIAKSVLDTYLLINGDANDANDDYDNDKQSGGSKLSTSKSKKKSKMKWQNYSTQGDLSMYSNNNAIKRERLRNNPEIIAIIDHWWSQVILAKYDKNHDDVLNKSEYMNLHKALGRALSDPSTKSDPTEETKMAEEDWLLDTISLNMADGARYLNENMFIRSIFELADLWTDTTNVQEYIQFLEYIFIKLYEYSPTDDTLSVQGTITSRSNRHKRTEGDDVILPNFIKRNLSHIFLKDGLLLTDLSENMINELKIEFLRCSSTNQINKKYSKSLNYRQFRDVLNSVGIGNVSSLSNSIFEVLDRDSSGHIDWHEFLVGICVLINGSPKKVLKLAFQIFDNNRNGKLSYTEIQLLLTHMSKGGKNIETNHNIIVNQIKKIFSKDIFRKYDTNNSQLLNYNQFEQLCWDHPNIIKLILGVDILDRNDKNKLKDHVKRKEKQKRNQLEQATELEDKLDSIDHMNMSSIIELCEQNNINFLKKEKEIHLRKRIKEYFISKFNEDVENE
jgi:Ca2+-binding EF-hand superfamily protein